MTVFVIMPVFNRLEMTRAMIECLRKQVVDETMQLIIVDDGSTDGTAGFLNVQSDLKIISGDGSLWWGGAIDRALRYTFKFSEHHDWVLFVNNDTRIENGFIQCLLNSARMHAPAAVGSVLRNERQPHQLISIGPLIDAWRFLTCDRLELERKLSTEILFSKDYDVDALSGRGVLFPAGALKNVNGMRPRWLPHYLADYELSLRLKAQGYKLVVAKDAAVYSNEDFGNTYRFPSLFEKLFSIRSPSYFPAVAMFWWKASNWPQRLTLPIRLIAFLLFPKLRNK